MKKTIAFMSTLVFTLSGFSTLSFADELYTVSNRNQATTQRFNALIEAENMSTISAQTNGTIAQILVDIGTPIKTGQKLLTILDPASEQQLKANQAQQQVLEQQLNKTRADFERAKQVIATQAISQAEFDQAQSAYTQTQSQLNAQQALVKQAQTQRGYSNVTAPEQGIINQRLVNVGEVVNTGKPLFTLFNPNELRIVAHIPQSFSLGKNAAAEAQLDGKTLKLGAINLLPSADPNSHTIELRAKLAPNQTALKPGLVVTLQLTGNNTAEQLSIPEESILRRSEVTAVYVHNGKQFQLRQIRTGSKQNGYVTVLSGLKAGEKIATKPLTIKK